MPSPYCSALTGLALMFMGLTGSNSGLLRAPGFIVSPVRKREMGGGEEGKVGKWE